MILFKCLSIILTCLLIAGIGSAFGQETRKIVNLFNPAHPKAVAGQKGWDYQKIWSIDLNNDGFREKVFLIADVSLNKGRFVWDDGQIWQVYIQTPSGRRTYVFSRLVQLGHVEVLAAREEPAGGNTILISERTPHALSLYEVYYRGHENFRTVQVLKRAIDRRRHDQSASPGFPFRGQVEAGL